MIVILIHDNVITIIIMYNIFTWNIQQQVQSVSNWIDAVDMGAVLLLGQH